MSEQAQPHDEGPVVTYEVRGPVAVVSLNRPRYSNAQNSKVSDPVVRMGIPGVEYFAHPWVMNPRAAKEFLFTGDRFTAQRAYELGMVNQVVPRADLERTVFEMAERIARMPRLGLALTKKAVNQAEELMGLRTGMDSVFGLHHVAHAHNAEVDVDSLAGLDARAMADAGKHAAGGA